MENKINVLLVEDDQNLGFLMSEFLSSKGFHTQLCPDGLSGCHAFESGKFHFIILDVMLPGMDGFEVARKIKEKQPDIPVIFVTARSMKEDKIKGFNLGVDDYITKPFDEDELYCRIQAIMNRTEMKPDIRAARIQLGRYFYEYDNQSLWLDGVCRRLTKRENDVMYLLVQNSDRIVKREEILKPIWGSSDYFSGRSLDVYISKLRKYIQDDPDVQIENISKVGFMLRGK
jgi:DNA-binding response OmpR family regulator